MKKYNFALKKQTDDLAKSLKEIEKEFVNTVNAMGDFGNQVDLKFKMTKHKLNARHKIGLLGRIAICEQIKKLMKEQGVTYQHLAEKSGFNSSNVFRMLNGTHATSIDNIVCLISALNADVKIISK